MYTRFLNPNDVNKLRENVDPDEKWYTDAELRHIIEVSGCDVTKCVVRCYLGIEQRARAKKDMIGVRWARKQLTRFEVGFTPFR